QFGKSEARRLIGGAAFIFRRFVRDPKVIVPLEAFSGMHGAPQRRFYNLLCIAYGADPKLFADIVEKGHLPRRRAVTCGAEYRELAFAFKQLIAPHLDQELMNRVLDKTWLPEPSSRGSTMLTVEEERVKAAMPGSEFKECANGCPV